MGAGEGDCARSMEAAVGEEEGLLLEAACGPMLGRRGGGNDAELVDAAGTSGTPDSHDDTPAAVSQSEMATAPIAAPAGESTALEQPLLL